MYLWLCTTSVHNTAQNSSDNLPSYLQTIIIAQMLSLGGTVMKAVRLKHEMYLLLLLLMSTNQQKVTKNNIDAIKCKCQEAGKGKMMIWTWACMDSSSESTIKHHCYYQLHFNISPSPIFPLNLTTIHTIYISILK